MTATLLRNSKSMHCIQQFSAAQEQTEAIWHMLPLWPTAASTTCSSLRGFPGSCWAYFRSSTWWIKFNSMLVLIQMSQNS